MVKIHVNTSVCSQQELRKFKSELLNYKKAHRNALSVLIKITNKTRMHSSRMRTGRALTVSGGVMHPRRNFGKKNLKKKFGEPLSPPRKIGDPQKIGDTPPEKLETPPFKKLETPPKNWRHRPPGTRPPHPPPLLTESQTRVKILP